MDHDHSVYQGRAESLFSSMKALVSLGDESYRDGTDDYRYGIVLLAVHAAISFSDTVLVAATGSPSTGDHGDAAERLHTAVKARKISTSAIAKFRRLLGDKHAFAYGPRETRRDAVASAIVNIESFAAWTYETLAALKSD